MGQWSRNPDEPPFVDLVPPEEAEGERKALYGELERLRGPSRVSNLFRAYSAFPALGMANFRRLGVLLTRGRLSVKFKEGIMTALAEVNRCDYCVSFHATAMRDAGATDDEVRAALSFDPEKMGLSEKEQALFEFAMRANGDPHGTTRADVDACRRAGADDHDLIETLETVNTGNSFNLVNGALNIGADEFLSYMTERGERWRESA